MYTGRTYHALIYIKRINNEAKNQNIYAYAIGGLKVKEGQALVEVERYSQES